MVDPNPDSGPNPPDKNVSDSSPSATEASEVECPNCGHEFIGSYCPNCGQEADPSATLPDVIGGFFREFVDVERGFWPTLVGLTVRPGEVLQDYLGGVRKGLISPGRYLLAALIVDISADRFLDWIGARSAPWADPELYLSVDPSMMSGGEENIFYTSFREAFLVLVGPQTRFITLLLMAGLLAAVLYRLFAELGRMSKALAVGCFMMAHVTFLSKGASVLHVVPTFLLTGQPVETPSYLLFLAISVGYFGFASYRGFGPGWKVALKGVSAWTWAYVLMISVFGLSTCVFAIGQAMWYPYGWYYLSSEAALTTAILFALPVLLHLGVETYLHQWGGR